MNIKETKRNITQLGHDDWVVYRHVRADKNMPFYIGIAKDINRPYNKKDRSFFWKNIINKTEYTIEIIFDNLTKEKAIEKEIEFIKLYGRVDLKTGSLCNMTCGGEGTGKLNKDLEQLRRNKIRKALTGIKRPEESIIKNCLSKKNRIPVTINNIEYLSLRQASLALGIHKSTVKKLYYIE
jgi:predicted GIY-YIG superfamily endonuclease